jgi:Spy/CpxP family protein refolding chaperone
MKHLILALATAALTYAQRPEPTFDNLKAQLKLTDAQVTNLQQIQTQTRQSMTALASEMRTKHDALRTLVASGSADANAVGRAVLEVEALRKRADTARTQAQTLARNVLTADQKAALTALENAQKLLPAIGEASRLGLLDRPEGADAGRRPFGFRGGPGAAGFGGPGRQGFGGPRGPRNM